MPREHAKVCTVAVAMQTLGYNGHGILGTRDMEWKESLRVCPWHKNPSTLTF